jgi:hypothetical protein
MQTIYKDAHGRSLEGYSYGHLEVQADSVINFDEAFSDVLSPSSPGEQIPDPLTPEDRVRLQKELKGVTRAQNIGQLAAMGFLDRAEYLRKQPL